MAAVLFSRLIVAYGWRGAFWIATAPTSVLILIWHSWVRDRPLDQHAPAHPGANQSAAAWGPLLGDQHLLLTGANFAPEGAF